MNLGIGYRDLEAMVTGTGCESWRYGEAMVGCEQVSDLNYTTFCFAIIYSTVRYQIHLSSQFKYSLLKRKRSFFAYK